MFELIDLDQHFRNAAGKLRIEMDWHDLVVLKKWYGSARALSRASATQYMQIVTWCASKACKL